MNNLDSSDFNNLEEAFTAGVILSRISIDGVDSPLLDEFISGLNEGLLRFIEADPEKAEVVLKKILRSIA